MNLISSRRVLFVSYGGAHVNAIIPIYHELSNRGYHCQYLALTTAKRVAEFNGIATLGVSQFFNLASPSYRKYGEILAQNHHASGKGINLEESIIYLGASFAELADTLGEDEAWKQYEKIGLNAFCPRNFASKIIKYLAPDLVLATTSPRMEKAFLQAAHRLSIFSVCMVELFGILEESWLSRPDNGSLLTVSRLDTKNRLIAAGRESSSIYLTGSPQFDYLANPKLAHSANSWRSNNNLTSKDVIIFFADQPEPNNPSLTTSICLELVNICEKKGFKLVVRPHPSNTSLDESLLGDRCYISRIPGELSDIIFSCTIGITLSSTVGWELLLANKPTIALAMSQYSQFVTYGDNDGALRINSLDKLECSIDVLLDPSSALSRKLEMYRSSLPPPGGASSKVANLIDSHFTQNDAA